MRKTQHYIKSSRGYNYLRYRRQPLVLLPPGEVREVIKTPEYKAALAAAKKADKPARSPQSKKPPCGSPTIRETVAGHIASMYFQELKPATRRDRRYYLLAWAEGKKAEGEKIALIAYGDLPILDLTRADIASGLMARKERGGPTAARNWLQAIRSMLQERKTAGLLPDDFDPTLGLHGMKWKRGGRKVEDGFKTWPREIMQQYRNYYPSGTPERIAFEMIYWTGAACADVIRLTRANIDGGVFQFDRQKTGTFSCPKAAPELLTEIAASKVIGLTGGPIIRGNTGLPFKNAKTFSEIFRKWVKRAGIEAGYTAHGIRKRAATDDAETGKSPTWLKAKYGWKTSAEVDLYTARFDRVRVILNETESSV